MTNQYLKEQESKESLLAVLTVLLKSIVQSFDEGNKVTSVFDCKGAPKVDLGAYMKRIFKYMSCSKSCLILSLILMDRFQEENPDFLITQRNIHKLIMTATVVATKSHQDVVYQNTYYAKISGFTLTQLNTLQKIFLDMISYKSYINPKTYHMYKQKIEAYLQVQEEIPQKEDTNKTNKDISVSLTTQKVYNY